MCFANARLVLDDHIVLGAIHVADDRIIGLTEGDAVPPASIDCRGDYIVPGLVELHTDNLERHMEPRPSVELPHSSAILAHDGELASTGITTVFDALRVGAVSTNGNQGKQYARGFASEILELQAANALRVRHLIHLRAEVCSETLIKELEEFGPEDSVGLMSLMDHTPGQRQFRDLEKLKIYYTGKHGYSEAEFDDLVQTRRALGDAKRDLHQHAARAAAKRLRATFASHDDTTAAHVKASKSMGIKLAEFPTTPEAAQACRDQGIAIIMGAPNLIRNGSHSGNVSAVELAQNGLLDIVSSDYVPALLMASAFRLAELWNDLPRAIRTVTASPAKATGLEDRGRLAVGCLADLVRVGTYDGTPVVRGVWRGGRQIG